MGKVRQGRFGVAARSLAKDDVVGWDEGRLLKGAECGKKKRKKTELLVAIVPRQRGKTKTGQWGTGEQLGALRHSGGLTEGDVEKKRSEARGTIEGTGQQLQGVRRDAVRQVPRQDGFWVDQ